MSDDGVEAEAYSHEKMRNLNSFYCLCAEMWWQSARWLMWIARSNLYVFDKDE